MLKALRRDGAICISQLITGVLAAQISTRVDASIAEGAGESDPFAPVSGNGRFDRKMPLCRDAREAVTLGVGVLAGLLRAELGNAELVELAVMATDPGAQVQFWHRDRGDPKSDGSACLTVFVALQDGVRRQGG